MKKKNSKKRVVLTDLHGNYRLFSKVLKEFPPEEHHYILLGDYIDRGGNSDLVVQEVQELVQDFGAVALKGNHEEMVFKWLDDNDSEWFWTWIQNGGEETLGNYGLGIHEALTWRSTFNPESAETVPPFFRDMFWLKENLLEFAVEDGVVYAHAAIPNFVDPQRVSLGVLGDIHLWNRPEHGQRGLPKNTHLSVHGHTPMENAPQELIFKEKFHSLYLDTGNYRTGRLVAFLPDTGEFREYQE